MKRSKLLAAGLLATLVAAGCSGNASAPSGNGSAFLPAHRPASASKIQHVVIVIQENRSFDNLFATFPGADGTTTGLTHDGGSVKLTQASILAGQELDHMHSGFVAACDLDTKTNTCRMDGFDTTHFGSSGAGKPAGTYPYRYVNPAVIKPYWTLARQYVLADHLFQTQGSGSFTAHQDLIAGGTAINAHESIIDSPSRGPWGCDAPAGTKTSIITDKGNYLFNKGPFPCFGYATLRDLLDKHHLSWKYYSPAVQAGDTGYIWNAFDAIRAVRYNSNEWSQGNWQCSTENVSCPETNIFSDIKDNRLPAVSWLIPDNANSDHSSSSDTGPSWVAQVVNAIGKSPAWKSTAIIILWDDWGGYYDHVPPPQLDYQSLGFRVPMIIVSPYARKGYVSHTQYEFGSILKFIENNWQLGRLGTTDVRATSIVDAFNFAQRPRKYVPVAAKYSKAFFLHQRPSNLPVDDE